MAEKNFYVLTTKVDLKEEVERLVFHGPYGDGFEMEAAIEDETLAKDANLLERLVVENNEIIRLGEPFRPGIDDGDRWFPGVPESPGLYWVVFKDQKGNVPFIIECNSQIQFSFYGETDPEAEIESTTILKYKPITIPTL